MDQRASRKFDKMSKEEQEYRHKRRHLIRYSSSYQWVHLKLPEFDRAILEATKQQVSRLKYNLSMLVSEEHADLIDVDLLCKPLDDLILKSLSDEYDKNEKRG